ncbi:MAG: carboxypeptidase-like regulatory domain-containing protein [Candidatus Hodarchaeota archaeon]
MKKILLPILSILFFTTCLEPPRDNSYDPYNQAYFAGTAYDHNGNPLEGAHVELKCDHEVKYETVTNSSGWYEFPEVIARTYTVVAEAEYYSTLYIADVYIPPSSNIDTFDIYFDELYFDFENEALGTQNPVGFLSLVGTWQIQVDPTEPDEHSTPNVYKALHTAASEPFALSVFRDTLTDFWFGVNIKVLSGSSPWNAGIALRYQDANNYYLVQFMTTGLTLTKIENGTPIQLAFDNAYTFSTDNWYRVSAYLYDNTIKVYLDYEELFEIQDNSSPFYTGVAGLWLHTSEPTGSATANFDDVHIRP